MTVGRCTWGIRRIRRMRKRCERRGGILGTGSAKPQAAGQKRIGRLRLSARGFQDTRVWRGGMKVEKIMMWEWQKHLGRWRFCGENAGGILARDFSARSDGEKWGKSPEQKRDLALRLRRVGARGSVAFWSRGGGRDLGCAVHERPRSRKRRRGGSGGACGARCVWGRWG